jgi:hypothetical protein
MIGKARSARVLPLAIFVFIFLYSSFFLQGLRLYDNDYNMWIPGARMASTLTLLWQVFNPILQDWNVTFRPTQLLIFKGLFALFEYDATGYYYFKSFALAAFCALYFMFLRRFLKNTTVAALSAVFIGTATSTFASSMWVSDFVFVSEFLALAVYWIFLKLETQPRTGKTVLWVSAALMVLLTLVCDRTKANGKLIPAILFLYVILSGYKKLKTHGPVIALMVVTVLPWKVLLVNPAPFLYAGTGDVDPAAWQPASLDRFWTFFGRDFEPFSLGYPRHTPISILENLGFPLLYAFIAAMFLLGWRAIKRRTSGAEHQHVVWFLIVWSGVNAMALMSYPLQHNHFLARYAISTLVPLFPLLLVGIYKAVQLGSGREWIARGVTIGLVVLQVWIHSHQTFRARNYFPTFMIAADTLRDHIAENYRDTQFSYFNTPMAAFRPTDDGNQFFGSDGANLETTTSRRVPNVPMYLVTMVPTFGSQVAELPTMVVPGKSESLFDRIFNGGPEPVHAFSLYLYEVRKTPTTDP